MKLEVMVFWVLVPYSGNSSVINSTHLFATVL
jgi:hypothetical protein